MKAMVLAAGVGSRLDPLTTQLPKPLVPVANRPVLEHILNLLKKHEITEIYSNLHYMAGMIVDHFADGLNHGVKLTFHYEAELSGDAGGVRALKEHLADDTFLVVMGDLITDADLTGIIQEHKRKGALATIALKRVEDVSQLGVALTNEEGFIQGFQEKPTPEEALSNLASSGIYVLEPEIFKHMPKEGPCGFGRQLFPQLVSAGLPVLGVEIDAYWSDVGTIEKYRLSNFDALKAAVKLDLPGQRGEFGWTCATTEIESGAHLSGTLMLGENTTVKRAARLAGHVIVGDNCVIEEGAHIENSVIWSNTKVGPGAIVRNSVIGLNCSVKHGAKHLEVATV